MPQTLTTVSAFAAMGAFALCSVLLNEGRHAARRRDRKAAVEERRRRALWSPSVVSPSAELPPRPEPRSAFSQRAVDLAGRVGSGVESVGARGVRRAFLASMLLAAVALLRGPAQRVGASVTKDRSRWSRLTAHRRTLRRGRTPSLPW